MQMFEDTLFEDFTNAAYQWYRSIITCVCTVSFLWTGTIFAVFQLDGKFEDDREWLKILHRCGESTVAPSFKSFGPTKSGPLALFPSR